MVRIPFFPGRYIKPISFAAEELAFNWSARTWVKANHGQFEIIHAQGRSGYLLFTIKAIREKLFSTVHGLIELETKSAKWYHTNAKLHRLFASLLEKRLLKTAKANISVSNALKQDIKKYRGQLTEMKVIPNGVQSGFEQHKLVIPKLTRFLFVGRLHPVKGISEIVNQMDKVGDNIVLDIIGDGPEKEKIERIIATKGLRDKVRLLGERPSEVIHDVMKYYQGLILPSHL